MRKISSFLRSNRIDAVLMAAAASVLFLATVVVSGKRPLWYDEIYSWTLVTDPSLPHMLYALRMAAESPPGLYHVLARMWLGITGQSTLALRLFSTLADVVALLALWTTLRRAFSWRATAVGVLTVFCTSAMMLFHSAEARFYPLFVACTALAITAYARAVESDKLTGRLAAALFLSNLALVQVHIYGVAYSAALMFALIGCDLATRRLRPLVYASIATAWLSLLPWLPTLHLVNESTKPRHWIMPPGLADVLEFYRLYSLEMPVILLAVAALCLAARWLFALRMGDRRGQLIAILVGVCLVIAVATERSYPPMLDIALLGLLVALVGVGFSPAKLESNRLRRALMVAAVVLVAAPPAAGIFSVWVKPVFVPKYVLPSMLGMAILMAWIVETGSPFPLTGRSRAFVNAGWAVLLTALLAMPLVSAIREDSNQPPLYGIRLADVVALAPPGTPVAVENYHLFLPLQQQAAGTGVRCFYLGDREAASVEGADRSALLHYRGAELWKNMGYLSDTAPEWHAFLASHPSFVVVHSPYHFWFDWRLRNHAEYTWRSLGKIGLHEVLLVERRSVSRPQVPRSPATAALVPISAK